MSTSYAFSATGGELSKISASTINCTDGEGLGDELVCKKNAVGMAVKDLKDHRRLDKLMEWLSILRRF
ncbi:hypothetical protein WV31_09880 [Magnetospirillum sp. ME-1]|nr:hypothetical protein WV31_09880 [Magnetospirillum sp. ME-1]